MQVLIEWLEPILELFGKHPYMKSLVVLALAFAVANLISFVVSRIVVRITIHTGTELDDRIVRLLKGPVYWTVILVGGLAAISMLEFSPSLDFGLSGILYSILIVLWSLFITRLLRSILVSISSKPDSYSLVRPQTLPLFSNASFLIVTVLAIYLFFETWNIDMTAWLASAGIIGIAVGFAAKDTLANLFAGVFILADGPYKIGDYIVLENAERGKVTHIGIRSTRILTRDDVEVTIPNSIMGNSRITNESGGPYEKFRIRVPVGAAYGSDIDQVRDTLLKVALEEPGVCNNPEPRVRFRRFGNSALDFELLCWVENPELRGRVVDALNSTIYKQFKLTGIEIPYSKHDIYIKEMPDKFK